MENLPDELLLLIFDFLPSWELLGSVRHVCRRWAAVLEPHTACVERPEEVEHVHRRTRNLRVATRIVPFRSFLTFFPFITPLLRELTIYAANPIAVSHFPLLEEMPCLEHLDVFLRDRVLDTQLLPVMLKMKSFVINEIVSARVLRGLAESKELRALYMYGRSLYYPHKELMHVLKSRRFHLRELTLRCTELNDAAYATVGLCEGLTSLQLYSCWLMTGAGAQTVTRLKKLRRLHVTGSRLVRTHSLTTFIDKLPLHVEDLNLSMSWFGDTHIAPLIIRLPRLRVLELWKCRLTQIGVMALAKNLIYLTTLDIDVLLTNEQILQLDKHPTLLFLRCLTEWSIKNSPYMSFPEEPKTEVTKVVTKNIKVVPCDERYPFKYFRGSGEGYRASLYYHWTQNVELEPLPPGALPLFDEEEDFY